MKQGDTFLSYILDNKNTSKLNLGKKIHYAIATLLKPALKKSFLLEKIKGKSEKKLCPHFLQSLLKSNLSNAMCSAFHSHP